MDRPRKRPHLECTCLIGAKPTAPEFARSRAKAALRQRPPNKTSRPPPRSLVQRMKNLRRVPAEETGSHLDCRKAPEFVLGRARSSQWTRRFSEYALQSRF